VGGAARARNLELRHYRVVCAGAADDGRKAARP
jgi:hypothetical protein